MSYIPISLKLLNNYSATYYFCIDSLEDKTINGLINYLYNRETHLKKNMDELKINLNNCGLFPKKGSYGLVSLKPIPDNGNLLDTKIINELTNSVVYLLNKDLSFN